MTKSASWMARQASSCASVLRCMISRPIRNWRTGLRLRSAAFVSGNCMNSCTLKRVGCTPTPWAWIQSVKLCEVASVT